MRRSITSTGCTDLMQDVDVNALMEPTKNLAISPMKNASLECLQQSKPPNQSQLYLPKPIEVKSISCDGSTSPSAHQTNHYLSPFKSKSSNTITLKNGEVKLVSPYGDYCAFSGGGGSGGCVITGPYEAMILPKDDYSDESFESTDESDAAQDYNDPAGVERSDYQNIDVVWAKRPCLPWFPGIIINPFEMTKESKDLIKSIGAPFPTKDQLSAQSSALSISKQSDKIYFVFLFNRKKTWLWLPEHKLRPFCDENDSLFLKNTQMLSHKYKKELEKAYKKAKKHVKSQHKIDSNHHLHTSKLYHLFHH